MQISGYEYQPGPPPGPGAEALPAHTMVGEFEIEGIIGEGGFGTVYLAIDHSLQRKVALKEYRPSALATRQGQLVVVRSQKHAEVFEAGLKSFMNEARTLARFDHRALVRVYRVWPENNTAYMAMALCDGRPLSNVVKEQPELVNEAWLKAMLAPLLEAVETLHSVQIFHRDIAPDNILIQENGAPMLLDFGAARQIALGMTQALTVIVKPGYAPIEQFAEDPSLKQGPWTDVYALGAVMYFAITGHAPPNSVARLLHDPLQPLAIAAPGGYSQQFLGAIDAALGVRPGDRPQRIAELRELFGLPQFVPMPSAAIHAAPPLTAAHRTVTELLHGPDSNSAPPSSVAAGTGSKGAALRPGGTPEPSPLSRPKVSPALRPGDSEFATRYRKATGSRKRLFLFAATVSVTVFGVGMLLSRPAPEPAPPTVAPPKVSVITLAPQPAAAGEANERPAATGTLRFAVKPWGEIAVDGVLKGVSPPLKRLTVAEGKHRVQISNPGFSSFSTDVELAKDQTLTVSYEFR